eukprot:GFUD01036928.1.p2 GENE.GFUD01036928.1~~GFUD01036928.1.p2  ORF type:complete len:208 (+),score=57.88 GFUD01036928.1:90-713(+)
MSSPTPPPVPCLLCRQAVHLVNGDSDQYETHLRKVHGVWSNRSWLVEQTFLRQKYDELSVLGDKSDLPNVLVKVVDGSEHDVANIENITVHVKDSLCDKLRRSTRKRSISRSPVEDKQPAKKVVRLVAAISIKEPEDMIMVDVIREVPITSSSDGNGKEVKEPEDMIMVDVIREVPIATSNDGNCKEVKDPEDMIMVDVIQEVNIAN